MQGFERSSKMLDKLNHKIDREKEKSLEPKIDEPGIISADGPDLDRIRVFRSARSLRDHGNVA